MTLGFFFWQCIYMHIKSHITALNPLSYKYKHVVVTICKDCLVGFLFICNVISRT